MSVRTIEQYAFNQTLLHPLAVAFLFLMIILMFFLPRRFAIFPVLLIACYITTWQRIVIAGLDFSFLRIILIVGFLRIIMRSEHQNFKIENIDKIFVIWVFFSIVMNVILNKTTGAFINRLGLGLDASSAYFFIRIILRDEKDTENLIKALILISIPICAAMLNEQLTNRNLFSVLGGVPEFTHIRDGRLRSQGAFAHPILAGTFGSFLFPLTVGLFFKNNNGKFLIVGLFTSLCITITSSSSGPALSLLGAILGLFFWLFHKRMRVIFWSAIFGLTCLHFIMTGPVWALIARAGVIGGSTAGFRYRLVNSAITRIDEWWLFGTKNAMYWGWGLQDICNMYIRVGIDGGLLCLILFVTIIFLSFKIVGNVIRETHQKNLKKYLWAIGCAYFSHTVAFMGVAYFSGFMFFWFLNTAIIVNLTKTSNFEATK